MKEENTEHLNEEIENNEKALENNEITVDSEMEEDYIATPEEVAAEAARSAQKRAEKKEKHLSLSTENPEEMQSAEPAVDPYTEPDPTLPKVPFEESPFLSRGCNKCPQSYIPVKERETRSCGKVVTCNWMHGIRQPMGNPFDIVEVRFKNNRKDFFRLPEGIDVTEGDVVAVEGTPGHDVGIVSLTGEVCRLQMKKKKVDPQSESIKKLFRRAKSSDIERWAEVIAEEQAALIKTRQICEDQNLVMKVNDVEFQGDRSKAIFYYTAEDRVDFRNLIKVLAEEFKVRVEMKQIGVRQEAGKVGGIGTCGRELCCSTWLTNFKSVTTNIAKTQQILPNPQKLAGQCGKLKCCLNFEYEVYVDALKQFPPANTPIRFQKGLALYKKTDIFRGIMWYAYEGDNELYAIPADSVKKIIDMNNRQEYPEKLEDFQVELMSTAALAQESTDAEFEMELRRLADSGNEIVEEDNKKGNRDDRNRQDKNNHRSNRDRGERDQNRHGKKEDHAEKRDRNERRGRDSQRRDRNERRGERNEMPAEGEGNVRHSQRPHRDNRHHGSDNREKRHQNEKE